MFLPTSKIRPAGVMMAWHGALGYYQLFTLSSLWIRPLTSAKRLKTLLLWYPELVSQAPIFEHWPREDEFWWFEVILQAVLNGVMTIPFIITVLFCIGDVTELIGSPIYGLSPYTQIVLNSTGKVGAAILLGTSSTVIAFGAGFDLWGAAARSLWSLGRDGALPPLFQRIHPKLGVPVECTLIMVPVAIPILMIYIWNSTAFFGVMAGVLVAFQLSYAMPIGLHAFYGRKKGGYIKGPVNLGRAGWYVDILAFCFTVFMITFMSFPVYLPVSGENM